MTGPNDPHVPHTLVHMFLLDIEGSARSLRVAAPCLTEEEGAELNAIVVRLKVLADRHGS